MKREVTSRWVSTRYNRLLAVLRAYKQKKSVKNTCTRLDSLSLLQYHYKCKANCNTLEKTRCLAIG